MSDRQSMFHDHHRALQDRFDGRRIADALEKHRRLDAFGTEQVALIEQAAFFFLATAHAESVDCSFKGGPPGFVRVTGPTTLEWPDFDGNSMYRSLGNIRGSGKAGLLFIRLEGSAERLRVNGSAKLLDHHPSLADYPGAKLVIRLEATEIFPNCPRHIPDLRVGRASEYPPEAGRALAKLSWKDRDYTREILSETDPHGPSA